MNRNPYQTISFPSNITKAIVAHCYQELQQFYILLSKTNAESTYQSISSLEQPSNLLTLVEQFRNQNFQWSLQDILFEKEHLVQAHQAPVRIEVRHALHHDEVVQIAVRGIYGDYRQQTLNHFKNNPAWRNFPLQVKASGKMSFEINVAGVDKALPMRFMKHHWHDVLDWLGYQPGALWDMQETPFFIAADGDGTMFAPPQQNHLSTLQTSPTYEPLQSILADGALFVLISGNDFHRTFQRFARGIDKNHLHRVIVVANGGASLAKIDHNYQPVAHPDYVDQALKVDAFSSSDKPIPAFYIGDDGRMDGNDFAGFKEAGWTNSLFVGAQHQFSQDMIQSGLQCLLYGEQSTAQALHQLHHYWMQTHTQIKTTYWPQFSDLIKE